MSGTATGDARLWRRMGDGDGDALGELFARHAAAVRAFCFRRTADLATADDLVSVVFLEAWRRRGTDLERPSALPLLLGLATNVVRNERRARRRYRAALARIPVPRPTADDAPDTVARLDAEQRARVALAALRRLPRHEQDVVALCLWMELSYADAAAALGVAPATIRSRLSRARAHLRTEMASLEGQPAERAVCATTDD